MDVGRRNFLSVSSVCIVGFTGCSFFGGGTKFTVNLIIDNNTNGERIFHFALENSNGIIEWHTYKLEPGEQEDIDIKLDIDKEQFNYHGIVDGTIINGALRGVESDVCIQLHFLAEMNGSGSPEILQDLTEEC